MAVRRGKKRREQQELVFRTWGGKRPNAGRKAAPQRDGFVPHQRRPRHHEGNPVHVTMRVVGSVPNLRAEVLFAAIVREIRAASARGLRVVHFSVQRNHVHMIVEASETQSLWRGLQRFESRVAMTINALARRYGKVWRDRYHRRDLTNPSQVRNALVYVLMNVRKHNEGAREAALEGSATLDGCSSAQWLDGWHPRAGPTAEQLVIGDTASPVVAPRCWLARKGWKTRGLIRITEMPKSPG